MKNKNRHYSFLLDNFINGRNYKIQIIMDAKSRYDAIKRMRNCFGQVICENIYFDYSEEIFKL